MIKYISIDFCEEKFITARMSGSIYRVDEDVHRSFWLRSLHTAVELGAESQVSCLKAKLFMKKKKKQRPFWCAVDLINKMWLIGLPCSKTEL